MSQTPVFECGVKRIWPFDPHEAPRGVNPPSPPIGWMRPDAISMRFKRPSM